MLFLRQFICCSGTFLEGEQLEKQAQTKLKPGMRFKVGTSADVFTVVERAGGHVHEPNSGKELQQPFFGSGLLFSLSWVLAPSIQ